MNKSAKIACIGKSKVESVTGNNDSPGFACTGDTLTAAIYLARSGLDVSFITVLDKSSKDSLCNSWQQEGLNTDLVLTGSSQAFFSKGDLDSIGPQLSRFDIIYLTGNTLALLDEESLNKLIELLVTFRTGGGKVVFDSKHKADSWSNEQIARAAYEKFMKVTDISLPNFAAESGLFSDNNIEELIARHHALGVGEIAVKNGTEANWLSTKPDKPPREFQLESIQEVLDNTGVGDAFNAAYLATRLSGKTYCGSIKQGQLLAAEVVLTSGAILPKS